MHIFIIGLIIYWDKIKNLVGLYHKNIDRIQIFVDAWDPLRLFISNYFNNAEFVPVFFSENGSPWDFLRKEWES
jgi:hypothetical protein